MANRQLALQLIPEFTGAATDLPVEEWLEDLELICKLCEIDKADWVLRCN